MSKLLIALFLGVRLFFVFPAYSLESDDVPKVEETIDFDMKALILSGIIAFIGLVLDRNIPADAQ